MDIHLGQRIVNASSDKVSVIITANYGGDEQQTLEATNNWHTCCVKKRHSFEKSTMWRGTGYFQPKYCELVVPGVLIDDFTLEYAGKFEQKFRKEVEPEIQNNLFEIVGKYQLAIRDARFGTSSPYSAFVMPSMIDVTPVRSSPALPPAMLSASMPFAMARGMPVLPTNPPARGAPIFQRPSFESIPRRVHSFINLADFVRDKIVPESPDMLPEIDYMQWHFDEPEHEQDHSVRLYLAFPPEDVALMKRWGLNEETLEQETMFDDAGIEALKDLQAHELILTVDGQHRAALAIEHKQQLQDAREAKIDRTIEDFMAWPYQQTFPTRREATRRREKLNGMLNGFKKKLEDYRAK